MLLVVMLLVMVLSLLISFTSYNGATKRFMKYLSCVEAFATRRKTLGKSQNEKC